MTTTKNNEHKNIKVPNLRFPEFQGEWEMCKASDLLDFYSTNSLSWDKLEYGTTKLLQKSEMRKDIVIELSYKGFS